MEVVVRFEKESCGRCGGTGQYHVGGSMGGRIGTCFECRGSGKTVSRRGKLAVGRFRKWAAGFAVEPTPAEIAQALPTLGKGLHLARVKAETGRTLYVPLTAQEVASLAGGE